MTPPLLRHLLATLLLLAAAGCNLAPNGAGMISERIGKAARDPAAATVDLGTLTSFGWDHFFVFRPGTPRDEVCRFIGAGGELCGRIVRYPAVPEDCQALVFALGQQITHLELHALANGRFDFTPPPDGQPRAAAVFHIHRDAPDRARLTPK